MKALLETLIVVAVLVMLFAATREVGQGHALPAAPALQSLQR